MEGETIEEPESFIDQQVPSQKSAKFGHFVQESDETASISTMSTIQSRHVTPASSFTPYDKSKPVHFPGNVPEIDLAALEPKESGKQTNPTADFDLAKVLDPFEQLEREFNWGNIAIRPPSAFGSIADTGGPTINEEKTVENLVKNSSNLADLSQNLSNLSSVVDNDESGEEEALEFEVHKAKDVKR